MDFYPGGELFYHMQKKTKISESQLKTYVGEIILALKYLHKHNIIYRDLKVNPLILTHTPLAREHPHRHRRTLAFNGFRVM
jgi:serine/threonine protein kinase